MLLPTRINRVLAIDPQTDFRTLVDQVFNGSNQTPNAAARYGVDVREDSNQLVIEADMPGFKKEDLEITLENQTLSISAQRQSESESEEKGEWLLKERQSTKFFRTFKLPQTVGDQSVNAKLEDGVLTITLAKREESKPRKILVS